MKMGHEVSNCRVPRVLIFSGKGLVLKITQQMQRPFLKKIVVIFLYSVGDNLLLDERSQKLIWSYDFRNPLGLFLIYIAY